MSRSETKGLAVALATVVTALFLTACGGGSRGPVTASQTTASTHGKSTTTRAQTDSLPGLVARIRGSVIRIEADACGTQSIGTGFLVGPKSVVTVDHVVAGASTITLKQGGKVVGTGSVVGEDPTRDVALVQSSDRIRGRVLPLASRSPELGETVAALGFPLGLPLTVTKGSVSGLSRSISIGGVRRHGMVQTDAAVNPGNSGGPLLSLDTGDVVGLVDLGTTRANGIAFAVSAQVAKPLVDAWEAAPQPINAATCAPQTQSPTASVPQPSPPTNPSASPPMSKAAYEQTLGPLLNDQVAPALREALANGGISNPSRLGDAIAQVQIAHDRMAAVNPPLEIATLHHQAVAALAALLGDMQNLRAALIAGDSSRADSALAALRSSAQEIVTIGNEFQAKGF